MSIFAHETEYRGAETMRRLGEASFTLCGAGALGSNLADALARQGVQNLRVIDRDKVEEKNIGTQIYLQGDVGAWKVEVLRNRLFRTTGVEIEAVNKDLTVANATKLLRDGGIVLDLFDNSTARATVQRTVRELNLPCLHVGLNADYAEVMWDEGYRVPQDVEGDVCDYPLARNLVALAVATAAETLIRYVESKEKTGWTITLRDLSIRRVV
jgi:molybdopterin-synthase adenylyltransferase